MLSITEVTYPHADSASYPALNTTVERPHDGPHRRKSPVQTLPHAKNHGFGDAKKVNTMQLVEPVSNLRTTSAAHSNVSSMKPVGGKGSISRNKVHLQESAARNQQNRERTVQQTVISDRPSPNIRKGPTSVRRLETAIVAYRLMLFAVRFERGKVRKTRKKGITFDCDTVSLLSQISDGTIKGIQRGVRPRTVRIRNEIQRTNDTGERKPETLRETNGQEDTHSSNCSFVNLPIKSPLFGKNPVQLHNEDRTSCNEYDVNFTKSFDEAADVTLDDVSCLDQSLDGFKELVKPKSEMILQSANGTGEQLLKSGATSTLRSSASATSEDSAGGILVPPEEDPVGPEVVEEYHGEWKQDHRSGFGVSVRSDGLRYEGEWFGNRKYGYGVTTHKDGRREEGKYKNNVLILGTKGAGGRRTAMFVRAAKLRERVEAAVSQAQRAAQMAIAKGEIATARMSTAKDRALEAEEIAMHAREDSDYARMEATRLCPDFLQSGPDMLKQFHSDYSTTHNFADAYPHDGGAGGHNMNPAAYNATAVPSSSSTPHRQQQQQQQQQQRQQQQQQQQQRSKSVAIPRSTSSQQRQPAGSQTPTASKQQQPASPETPPMVTPPSSLPQPDPNLGIPVSELSSRLDSAEGGGGPGNPGQRVITIPAPIIEPTPAHVGNPGGRQRRRSSQSVPANKPNTLQIGSPPPAAAVTPSTSSLDNRAPPSSGPPGGPPGASGGLAANLDPMSVPPGHTIQTYHQKQLHAQQQHIRELQEHQQRQQDFLQFQQEHPDAPLPELVQQFAARPGQPQGIPPRQMLPPHLAHLAITKKDKNNSGSSLLGDHFDQYIDSGGGVIYQVGHSRHHQQIPRRAGNPHELPPDAQQQQQLQLQHQMSQGASMDAGPMPSSAGIVRRSTLATAADRFGLATAFGVNPAPGAIVRSPVGIAAEPPALPAVEHLFGRAGIQRSDSKQSLPDATAMSSTPVPMSREECSRLSSRRRLELRRMREEDEVYRANPLQYLFHPAVKDWFARRKLFLIFLAVNLSLSLVFYRLLANEGPDANQDNRHDNLPPLD